MGSVKSSGTDYNESNKPNTKFLAHIGSEKSLVEFEIPKKELFTFFHIFRLAEKFTFSHGFLKRIINVEKLCDTKLSKNCD